MNYGWLTNAFERWIEYHSTSALVDLLLFPLQQSTRFYHITNPISYRIAMAVFLLFIMGKQILHYYHITLMKKMSIIRREDLSVISVISQSTNNSCCSVYTIKSDEKQRLQRLKHAETQRPWRRKVPFIQKTSIMHKQPHSCFKLTKENPDRLWETEYVKMQPIRFLQKECCYDSMAYYNSKSPLKDEKKYV